MRQARPIDLGTEIAALASEQLALLTVSVPEADRMTAGEFRAAVQRAYDSIGSALCALGQTAIRLWNYMPDPGARLSTGLDRYMVFNQGRSAGYRLWSERGSFSGSPATASAVGFDGDAFVVHCLAAAQPGTSIENPRQISSWRYSSRYGPTPPSFSRATVATISGTARLLIGGTASIVGEDTMHVGSIAGQADETLNNLAALIATARSHGDSAQALSYLRDVRIYLTRPEDAGFLRHAVEARCPRLDRVELAVTRLCRPELLVEIEGVADINRPA